MAYGIEQGIQAAGQEESVTGSIHRKFVDLNQFMDRIEKATYGLCGSSGGEAKSGPVPVPNGAHAQWSDALSGLCDRAARIASTLENA